MAGILRGEIRWTDLNPVRGRERRSWVKINQIRTLAVERIGKKIAKVQPQELSQIIDGFNEIVS